MSKNLFFQPNNDELAFISIINSYLSSDFSVFRITETMHKKSIIDASSRIRDILKANNIADFSNISKGEKVYVNSISISPNSTIEHKCSFYRPTTKEGDPRFWPSNFKKYVSINDLILFTTYNQTPVFIVVDSKEQDKILSQIDNLFKISKDSTLRKLESELIEIREKGWIDSVSLNKNNDKDVGLTLEREFNIMPNSSQEADYFNEIEFKSKRSRSKTKDSLFSVVPDWKLSTKKKDSAISGDISKLKSKYYLSEYGIPSPKHPGYNTLYVTVSSKPNPQGMFLETSDKEEVLKQHFINKSAMCVWEYSKLKARLINKHRRTVWIKAEDREYDGKIQFRFLSFQYSEKPSFNQFLSLIPLNIITLDWTHYCLPDMTHYNDHGFLFRITPKYRELLFGSVIDIC